MSGVLDCSMLVALFHHKTAVRINIMVVVVGWW